MEKVRLGIIGVGNMGSGHIGYINKGECPEIELTAVCDVKEDRRAWAKENCKEGVTVFSDAIEMLDSGLIDAVIVAVPHYFHPYYVMEALKRGIHAMSEKPAGVYTKQVREMNEFAEKQDKVFGMMFNQRTNCVYRKMKELVSSKELGEIKRVNWIITDWYRTQAYYNSGGWRATWDGEGGGVLLNQCPHNLDLLQWICGLPTSVRAFTHNGKWHDIEVEDDVTAYLEFENGATGVFVTTTGDAPGTNRFEITLEKGKLVCENNKLMLYKLKENEREYCFTATEGFKAPDGEWIEVETDGENPQHKGVVNAFAARILHGTPLVAEGTEGIRGLMLSNAMHLSSWRNETVTLPVDEDVFLSYLTELRKNSKKKVVKEVTFNTEGSYGAGN